ncbi:transcriptional regulator [Rhodococcus sp. WS4]|nr:transcriptional regulator [Rhodococcus sp. WS4]
MAMGSGSRLRSPNEDAREDHHRGSAADQEVVALSRGYRRARGSSRCANYSVNSIRGYDRGGGAGRVTGREPTSRRGLVQIPLLARGHFLTDPHSTIPRFVEALRVSWTLDPPRAPVTTRRRGQAAQSPQPCLNRRWRDSLQSPGAGKDRRMTDIALQTLVDDLAEFLSRAVVVDDPELQLICASRHFGDEDAQRIRAVLQRDVGLPATRHILSHGVTTWVRPAVIPENPELGMVARLCAPVRHRGFLLGLLLVIDAHGSLTAHEIEHIEHAVAEIGAHLYASHLAVSEQREAQEKAVRELLSREETKRQSGVRYLHESGRVPRRQEILATVVHVVEAAPQGSISATAALRAALNDLGSPMDGFAVLIDGQTACLLQVSTPRPDLGEADKRAHQILQSLRQLLGPDSRCVAGVGGTVTGLDAAWSSYEQARIAVRAAEEVTALEPVAAWDHLGSYALMLQLAAAPPSLALLPRPIRALIEPGESEWLVETLACYLDHAGSAPRAAAALHIHRTSLYYRLDRIRELTGLDLDDGENRLLLHLGVRLIKRRQFRELFCR